MGGRRQSRRITRGSKLPVIPPKKRVLTEVPEDEDPTIPPPMPKMRTVRPEDEDPTIPPPMPKMRTVRPEDEEQTSPPPPKIRRRNIEPEDEKLTTEQRMVHNAVKHQQTAEFAKMKIKDLTEELADHKSANSRTTVRMAELRQELGQALRQRKEYKDQVDALLASAQQPSDAALVERAAHAEAASRLDTLRIKALLETEKKMTEEIAELKSERDQLLVDLRDAQERATYQQTVHSQELAQLRMSTPTRRDNVYEDSPGSDMTPTRKLVIQGRMKDHHEHLADLTNPVEGWKGQSNEMKLAVEHTVNEVYGDDEIPQTKSRDTHFVYRCHQVFNNVKDRINRLSFPVEAKIQNHVNVRLKQKKRTIKKREIAADMLITGLPDCECDINTKRPNNPVVWNKQMLQTLKRTNNLAFLSSPEFDDEKGCMVKTWQSWQSDYLTQGKYDLDEFVLQLDVEQASKEHIMNDKNHPSKKHTPRNVFGTDYAFRRNFDPGYAAQKRKSQPKRPTPRQRAKQAAAELKQQRQRPIDQQLHLEEQFNQAGPSNNLFDPQQVLRQQELQEQFQQAIMQPGPSHRPPVPERTYRHRTEAPDTPPNPYSNAPAPSSSRDDDVSTSPNANGAASSFHHRPTHKTGVILGTARMTQPRRIMTQHAVNAPEWKEHRVSKPPPASVRRTVQKSNVEQTIPDVHFYEDVENRAPIVRNKVGKINETDNVHDPMWSATELVVHEGLDGM